MSTITLEIPIEIIENFQSIDEFKKVLFEDFVAEEFKKGTISIRQGAKMLGLTYEEFMVDFLGNRNISFINGTNEELDVEFKQEEAWLNKVIEARK